MTVNPHCTEIRRELLPGQAVQDRPENFQLKKKYLLDLISKDKIFGDTVARIHTLEFQKRGLPHMHLLIWFDKDFKIRDPHQVDSMTSAEFPDPVRYPGLYKVVCDKMTHGPCGEMNPGAPCMKDGKCSKRFPKPFCEETTLSEDGYPKYHHRNDGRQHNVRGHMLDNRWIVPYSPRLLWVLQCHINLKFTFNVRCVKYIHKYPYKGLVWTTMEFGISYGGQAFAAVSQLRPVVLREGWTTLAATGHGISSAGR
jgi:hypothetical protein